MPVDFARNEITKHVRLVLPLLIDPADALEIFNDAFQNNVLRSAKDSGG
jgi:hypothetical protein